MATNKKWISSFIILSLFLETSAYSMARKKTEDPTPVPSGTSIAKPTVVIKNENLEDLLFSKNLDLTSVMNNVLRARDTRNMAIGALIPSLNLGAIFSATSSPTFGVSAVSCLVPFLFPTNWFDVRVAKKNFNAEVLGLHVTRLNAYAIAYTSLSRVSADFKTLELMATHEKRLQNFVDDLEIQLEAGLIGKSDFESAQSELNKVKIDSSKIIEMVGAEKAAVRKMFDFDLDQDFEIQLADLPGTGFESQDPEAVLQVALEKAPEKEQLVELKKAAKAAVWSAAFAWLGGCSGSQGQASSTPGSAAFNVSTGASVTIGYGMFPRIKLAKRNVKDMDLREEELQSEIGRVIESTLIGVEEANLRKKLAQQNIANYEDARADSEARLNLGKSTIREVLENYSLIESSQIEALSSTASLTGYRMTLDRTTLSAPFDAILAKSKATILEDLKKLNRQK